MGSWRDPLQRAYQPAFCAQTVVAFYGLSQYHHICNVIRKTTPKMLHEGYHISIYFKMIINKTRKKQESRMYLNLFETIHKQKLQELLDIFCMFF